MILGLNIFYVYQEQIWFHANWTTQSRSLWMNSGLPKPSAGTIYGSHPIRCFWPSPPVDFWDMVVPPVNMCLFFLYLCCSHFRNVLDSTFQSFPRDASPHWFCLLAHLWNWCQALTQSAGTSLQQIDSVLSVYLGQRSYSGQWLTKEDKHHNIKRLYTDHTQQFQAGKTCVLNCMKTNWFPVQVQENFIFQISVKRVAVSVVKSQTIVSLTPTTSSHWSILRFSRMQMGDVIPPASPHSALGSLPGLARCLDRFSSWWGGTLHSKLPLWGLSSSPSLRSCYKRSPVLISIICMWVFLLLLTACWEKNETRKIFIRI